MRTTTAIGNGFACELVRGWSHDTQLSLRVEPACCCCWFFFLSLLCRLLNAASSCVSHFILLYNINTTFFCFCFLSPLSPRPPAPLTLARPFFFPLIFFLFFLSDFVSCMRPCGCHSTYLPLFLFFMNIQRSFLSTILLLLCSYSFLGVLYG